MLPHVANALTHLETALVAAKHPRLLCSFGKDSVVVLDLAAAHGLRDVLLFEDPYEVMDWAHVRTCTQRWNLSVKMPPRGRSQLYFVNGQAHLLSLPPVARAAYVAVPTTLRVDSAITPTNFVCTDDDLRATHGATVAWETDLLVLGYKLVDTEARACGFGQQHLNGAAWQAHRDRMAQLGPHFDFIPARGVRGCAPLFGWTDADVWSYVEAAKLPVSSLVYDLKTLQKRPAPPACARCHDPAGPIEVFCPKWDTTLLNLGALRQDDGLLDLLKLGVLTADEFTALREAA